MNVTMAKMSVFCVYLRNTRTRNENERREHTPSKENMQCKQRQKKYKNTLIIRIFICYHLSRESTKKPKKPKSIRFPVSFINGAQMMRLSNKRTTQKSTEDEKKSTMTEESIQRKLLYSNFELELVIFYYLYKHQIQTQLDFCTSAFN